MNEKTNNTEKAKLTVEDVKNADFDFDELTEEQFHHKATDGVQVRNLADLGCYNALFSRSDVTKKFEVKCGNKKSYGNDTRRRIALYKIPRGYLYFLSDEVHTRYEYSKSLPKHDLFVDDMRPMIEFVVNEKDEDYTEGFEFTFVSRDDDPMTGEKWTSLRRMIENDLKEEFE